MMKKSKMILFVLLCLTFSTVGCKKKSSLEVRELEFAQKTYYVSEGEHINILVANGNKKYELDGFDEELILPMVSVTDFPAGAVYIKAIKKGKSDLVVKDEVSGQEVKLTINVVDPFLAMKVREVFPIIKNEEYESSQAIRNKVRTEPQSFFDFETRNVLVLQQNINNRFWLFKNEEDAAHGNIHKSGTFKIRFSYGGPNRLWIAYDDSDETIEYDVFSPDQTLFSTLLRWAQKEGIEGRDGDVDFDGYNSSSTLKRAEIPQRTSPVEEAGLLFLVKDFTSSFKEDYPKIERVDLFQGLSVYNRFPYLRIADGILNP